MWLIISSLSLHNLHLLFCCILSISDLTYWILRALFYVAIRRDSVSFLTFPFRSHVQELSCEILLVSRLKYLVVVVVVAKFPSGIYSNLIWSCFCRIISGDCESISKWYIIFLSIYNFRILYYEFFQIFLNFYFHGMICWYLKKILLNKTRTTTYTTEVRK